MVVPTSTHLLPISYHRCLLTHLDVRLTLPMGGSRTKSTAPKNKTGYRMSITCFWRRCWRIGISRCEIVRGVGYRFLPPPSPVRVAYVGGGSAGRRGRWEGRWGLRSYQESVLSSINKTTDLPYIALTDAKALDLWVEYRTLYP